MRFLQRALGIGLREEVKRSDTQREIRVESRLFLSIERSERETVWCAPDRYASRTSSFGRCSGHVRLE